jgi:hypothetical protein
MAAILVAKLPAARVADVGAPVGGLTASELARLQKSQSTNKAKNLRQKLEIVFS